MITRVLNTFGNRAIRGSSSKGGIQALRAIIAVLKKGDRVAITPDGPRGPALELKDGIIHSARSSGVPIIPFFYASSDQWVLEKSWDRHIIPKPFSTLVASYGEPIDVKTMAMNKTDEELKTEITRLLTVNMENCHREIARIKDRTKTPPIPAA